jgi:DNA-binding HxlR family transcriptional regulator
MKRTNNISNVVSSVDMPPTCAGVDRHEMRALMGKIGDKWTISVIGMLAHHPQKKARFSELERAISGISQRMLTTTLRSLERDGIVVRKVFPEVPPRVEYQLSILGRSLVLPIRELIKWATENYAEVERARDKFDRALADKKLK